MADTPDKTPPCNIEAEACLLGCIMHEPIVLDEIDGVTGSTFYRTAHQLIFPALQDLHATGQGCEPVMLREELLRRGQLEAVGGTEYIGTLFISVAGAVNSSSYARLIVEKARIRRLMAAAQGVLADLNNPRAEPDAIALAAVSAFEKEALSVSHADLFKEVDLSQPPPPIEWLVEGFLEKECLAMMFGTGGAGKTFVQYHLGKCVAGGEPFFGMAPPRPLSVVYLDFEQSWKLIVRRANLLGGLTATARKNFHYCHVVRPMPIETEMAEIMRLCREKEADLCICDCLEYMHANDIRDNAAMKLVIFSLKRVVEKLGTTILVAHHTRKSQDEKIPQDRVETELGAAVLRNLTDVSFIMTRQGPVRHLKHSKNKLGPEMKPLDLTWVEANGQLTFKAEVHESQDEKVRKAMQAIREYLYVQETRSASLKLIVDAVKLPRRTVARALAVGIEEKKFELLSRGIYALAIEEG